MKKYLSLIGLLLVLMACEEDIPQKQDFPIIQTLEPVDNDESGATFRAKVLQIGNVETSAYGFVWGTGEPSGVAARKIELGPGIQEGFFEARLDYSRRIGETYNIRAFAESGDQTVYGNMVSIVSESEQNNKWRTEKEEFDLASPGIPHGSATATKGRLLFYNGDFYTYNLNDKSFTQEASFPVEGIVNTQFSSASQGEVQYYMSNLNTNLYRFENGAWSIESEIPFNTRLAGYYHTYISDNKLYILGNSFAYYYDLSSKNWQVVANIPEGDFAPAKTGVSLGANAYILSEDKKVWKYEPSADSWEAITTYPSNVGSLGTIGFAAKDKIYFGFDYGRTSFGFLGVAPSFHVYALDTPFWIGQRIFPRKVQLNGFFVFSIFDKLYVGQMSQQGNNILVFDPEL